MYLCSAEGMDLLANTSPEDREISQRVQKPCLREMSRSEGDVFLNAFQLETVFRIFSALSGKYLSFGVLFCKTTDGAAISQCFVKSWPTETFNLRFQVVRCKMLDKRSTQFILRGHFNCCVNAGACFVRGCGPDIRRGSVSGTISILSLGSRECIE